MMRRRRQAVLSGVVLVLLVAAPARAASEWDYGPPEETTEESCVGIINPAIDDYQINLQVRAGMLVDPQAPPKVGEVFYGAVWIGQAGGCYPDHVQPEALPPIGVELAVSAEHPVRCFSRVPASGPVSEIPPSGGCPQRPGPGRYGGLGLTPFDDRDRTWTLDPNELFMIEFPLRSSRPLTGLPGGPTCPDRTAKRGACPPDTAGDFLQTPVKVYDDGFAPTLDGAIGLVVQGPAGGGGGQPTPGAPGPTTPGAADPGMAGAGTPGAATPGATRVKAPKSMRLRSALAGVRFSVTIPAAGTRVTATLSAAGKRVAVVRRRAARAGELQVLMKPTRTGARALRQARSARLRVTLRPPGKPPATEVLTIALRR